jgi:hypothetical protein
MNDEQFDELMRDAAHTYRLPPDPDFDRLWAGIERRLDEPKLEIVAPTPWRRRVAPYVGLAATLVVGIGIGRFSMLHAGRSVAHSTSAVQRVASLDRGDAPSAPYQTETSAYLGQTAALLIALPAATRGGQADEQFTRRAGDLLTRTRLLIDSPASSDPQIHELLEDLELVLAQIVRLKADTTDHTELDLINRALEQRDVIPRLRTAVEDISAY